MADVSYTRAYWTVGQALQAYRKIIEQNIIWAARTITPMVVITNGGYKALRFEVDLGGYVVEYTFRILACTEDATLSYRYLLMDPQWNGSGFSEYELGAETMRDWGFLFAFWLTLVPVSKVNIIEMFTGCSVEQEQNHSVQSNETSVSQGIWRALVISTSGVMSCEEVLTGYYRNDPFIEFEGCIPAPPMAPAVAAGYPATQKAADIAPLVEALQAISMMDMDISFNNGQTVCSIRGRATP